ncbi:MAG: hypothetical protein R3C11_23285 [Planctomycetaceae bacterium]
MRTVLYKVGGSLLTDSTLFARLEQFLQTRDQQEFALILVGGGAKVDLIREQDVLNAEQDDEKSHQLALKVMDSNAELALKALPASKAILQQSDLDHAVQRGEGRPVLFAQKLLTELEPRSDLQLPHTWEATSDSIGAWLTITLKLDEFRLLKSIPPLPETELISGNSDGVDRAFHRYVSQLPGLSWVNFRQEQLVPDIHYYNRIS